MSPPRANLTQHASIMDMEPSNAGGLPRGLMDSSSMLMNEDLQERFGRYGSAQGRDKFPSTRPPTLPMKLNRSIRQYHRDEDKQQEDSSRWTGLPEIPSEIEIWVPAEEEQSDTLELQENIVVGPYPSKEAYLETHYRLLREDTISPMRDVVRELQLYPGILEKDSDNDAFIYEKVFITGFTFANAGIAARVKFSLRRLGKRVNWEQSKRLRSGTLIALTPADNNFRTICKVAVVAARPLPGLLQNPPEIDLYFGKPEEIELDPQQEWLMVECRNGYFEGHRHTMKSLQHLQLERFPLAKHIVDLEREVRAPDFIEEQPFKDLRGVFPEDGADELRVNVLGKWPNAPSNLDKSQLQALKRVLTKSLAIVQGPPGTGKTYLSVLALDIMLQNSTSLDPPIVLAAQTNHALDQLLRHISKFEPDFVRLGAMTKDYEIVKPRTLSQIKSLIRPGKLAGGLRDRSFMKLKGLTEEITQFLAPLTSDEIYEPALFKKYKVINERQFQTLIEGAKEWVSEENSNNEMATWLGDERVEAYRLGPEDFGFLEEEDEDLDIEHLKETEAEDKISDNDEDFETLKGRRIDLAELWTGRDNPSISEKTVGIEAQKENLWEIVHKYRGPVYRLWQRKLKKAIRELLNIKIRAYTDACKDTKIGRLEIDYNYLQDCRIIGVTTTGLSKYRALLQSLKPKIVLIEEAAETLEAFAITACFPSVQQLILIGDHAQLRGQPHDRELSGRPFFLDVSLLERMVRNYVGYTQLNVQRRMTPEIRRLISPVYTDLTDHPSVLTERSPVPGMGGINTFFLSHSAIESSDEHMSKVNEDEASMVCQFLIYLTKNGVASSEITVLTCYQGQRRLIWQKLRREGGHRPAVETVDSYQGEENAIILLSLVRSNRSNKIGFLANENRACVALSRAQRGFYIFGNAPTLCKSSMLWWYVVQKMAEKPCRVGFHLPLTCTNHRNTTFLQGEISHL